MKNIIISFLIIFVFVTTAPAAHAQQKIAQIATSANNRQIIIRGITQDKQGYIWLTAMDVEHGQQGLFRYDGSEFTFYSPDSANSPGLPMSAICLDSSGMIWVGTVGRGLYRFNPVTHSFTHFQHSSKDPASLANNAIAIFGSSGLLEDHEGNLWIGTFDGLDLLRHNTGKFIHFRYKPGDASGLSSNIVFSLYEDRKGNLWVGCFGNPSGTNGTGGLNLFHPATGTFTHYMPDPQHPQSPLNVVSSIYEDSRGTLWVGTTDNGLLTLNRNTGAFTRYPPYNPDYPDKLGSLPLRKGKQAFISFITGDFKGNLWIGTMTQGMQKYNFQSGKATHYGYLLLPSGRMIADTTFGFGLGAFQGTLMDKNGILWIVNGGKLYYINPSRKSVPYNYLHLGYVNDFYKDNKGAVWIATAGGLLYKPKTGKEKLYVHNPHDINSLTANSIGVMVADNEGNLWLGSYGGNGKDVPNGVDKFNMSTGKVTHYTDSGRLKNYNIQSLCLDSGKYLWIGTNGLGLLQLNLNTGIFTSYQQKIKKINILINNNITALASAGSSLWVGLGNGLDKFNKKTATWTQYHLPPINFIYPDASGVLWAGTQNGLYRYDSSQNRFHIFRDSLTNMKTTQVQNIVEDHAKNLWVTCPDGLYRINARRTAFQVYGAEYGIHTNQSGTVFNLLTKDGELFIGDQTGYYSFYPDSLTMNLVRPEINITGFQLGDKKILPGPDGPLRKPLYQTAEIRLGHTQNSFSFDFAALDYTNPGVIHYRYMLQGYDNRWHDAGELHRAYFFSVPVGHYIFRVMAVNSNNVWSEKDITVIISPPWWTTWWAILIFVTILAGIIWGTVYLRSRQLRRANKLLEEKIDHRTKQLQESLENLKSTQKQLIQSEKMASLGELTAGIAHEIQNPLNFVNNFSDINKELVDDLKSELATGNLQSANEIADDIKANEEKINHHGKRADAIVKGMLQHSRTSTRQKELTDINALCDEYLRLAYHGMRAKDKSFNCTLETHFDSSLPKINVVPQDVGRVILNLINNAFYACAERRNLEGFQNLQGLTPYLPTVTISTKNLGDKVEISVKDNGNGIPEKIKDKIFQPFFTTKPTGQGTGLGLSLSYDIVKAHGGEIKVESLPAGEAGTEFIVLLPL